MRQLHLNWFREVLPLIVTIFGSGANLLTNSPKNSDLTKGDLFHFDLSPDDDTIEEKFFLQISAVFATHEHVDCGRVF